MAIEGERVLYVVRTWVPEEQLEEWDQWHTTVHVPEVVEQPQIKRARKYRVLEDSTPAEWPAQYITVYELDTVEDWESYNTSEAAAVLRKDYDDHYGATGKISRQVLVEVAEIAPVEIAEIPQ
jgi:hypothetical protein